MSKLEGSVLLVTVIVLFLAYMCFCLYFTLLRVKVFRSDDSISQHPNERVSPLIAVCTKLSLDTQTAHLSSSSATLSRASCPLFGIAYPVYAFSSPLTLMSSYNFLDMLRELSTASTDKAKKSFNLQFEAVWGGQGSFAGISFDRYLPTAIVFVSFLVTFNFFRLHNVLLSPSNRVCGSLALSQFFCSKMSAYFRGRDPNQADFMQQGSCLFCASLFENRLKVASAGRALLKLERANLERRAVFVA